MMQGYLHQMGDPRFVAVTSHLSPAWVRVGGISSDFIIYAIDGQPQPSPTPVPPSWGWPRSATNFSTSDLTTLLGFLGSAGLRLMLDLNELIGRTCNNTNPSVPYDPGTWCEGAWDSSNARALLQWIHDAGLYGPGSTLAALSAGNELHVHLDPGANTADIVSLSEMVQAVWGGPASARPPVYGTDTDDCLDNATQGIMDGLTGHAAGFTYHAYPGGSGSGPGRSLEDLLLNATWLRTGIMTGSSSEQCIGWWNAGPRAAGLELLVTESSR